MQIGKSFSNNIPRVPVMNKLIQLLFVASLSALISIASSKYRTEYDIVSTEEIGYKMY